MTKKDNTIGYNSKDKNVFNSIGNIHGDNFQVDFVKDPQKLIYQYHNLIYNLGKRYAHRFKNEADRQALFAYILDAFYSLVLEYDPKSGVDFPGYIDRKLKDRVYFSYVNKLQPSMKVKARHITGKHLKFDNKVALVDTNNDIEIIQVYTQQGTLSDSKDYYVMSNQVKLLRSIKEPIYVDYVTYEMPKTSSKEFLLKQDEITVEDLQSYQEESITKGASYDRKGKIVFQNPGSLSSDNSLFSLVSYLQDNYKLTLLDYAILQFLATGNPNQDALNSQVSLQIDNVTPKQVHKEYLKIKHWIVKYFEAENE